MKSMLRQFRRAPGRIVASVLALALAIGAIGVLAIPRISEGTLHAAVDSDGLADVIVSTTPLGPDTIEAIADLDAVVAAEGQAVAAVQLGDGFLTRLIGLPLDEQTMDVLRLSDGRLPSGPGEVVGTPALGAIGDTVLANGRAYEIVGHGSTLWWSGNDVLFADVSTVAPLTGGPNRVVVTATDDGEEALRELGREIRTIVQADGDTFTRFPIYLPNGSTPIDADIDQVSQLIGLLGVAAGLVALVLLAGTTNTLITERSREVAVMRALGGRSRAIRRRLRRIALAITAVALVIGLPLGIVISNVIARMVLEEFIGVTPDLAIDWRVLVLSAAGALVGARLVSARAARRVASAPLAEALRDRDAVPFGRTRLHRLVARIGVGRSTSRLASRAPMRRPARTVAIVTQIAAAVGAAFMVPSLIVSVNEYNTATTAPWTWETLTVARDPGLPIDPAQLVGRERIESGIWTSGEVAGWGVDLYGLAVPSRFFDAEIVDGEAAVAGSRGALVSVGFAERVGLRPGDDVMIEMASGPMEYRVAGTVDDHARTFYIDRDVLSADLGEPGMANVIWSADAWVAPVGVATRTSTATQIAEDDAASRDAIAMIFGAIGVVVAGVAALAVFSSMSVDLFERRRELAALQALGARRRRVRRVLLRELAPIALVGTAGGLALGALGSRGIIASFEASNAVDIGVVDAVGAVPFIVAGALVALVALVALITQTASRRPVAATLRSAT